eukprot:scaffold527_cov423-Pavlova_lutheri.AAC.1
METRNDITGQFWKKCAQCSWMVVWTNVFGTLPWNIVLLSETVCLANLMACSVQVGSRTGDTWATSELRLSSVVEVLEEADEARRSSWRTSRKVNCKAKRGTGGPSLKTTQWRLR